MDDYFLLILFFLFVFRDVGLQRLRLMDVFQVYVALRVVSVIRYLARRMVLLYYIDVGSWHGLLALLNRRLAIWLRRVAFSEYRANGLRSDTVSED